MNTSGGTAVKKKKKKKADLTYLVYTRYLLNEHYRVRHDISRAKCASLTCTTLFEIIHELCVIINE